jgi:cobalt-zinc-cadmium efflux system outer membrane protein
MTAVREFVCGAALALAASAVALAQPGPNAGQTAKLEVSAGAPGESVESLLALARQNSPELAGMRYEAEAAAQRVVPAGALPDPRLRTELMDTTRTNDQFPSVFPARVGSTKYTLMQDLPWFGKRELRREAAQFDAQGARERVQGTWNEIAAKIKAGYAQLWYLNGNEKLLRELLDITRRLEGIAQARYAGGLAAQQDVIRAMVEQTGMQNELLALAAERRQASARLNALVGRAGNAPLADPRELRAMPQPARLEFAALADRARARNPALAADEARIQAAQKTRDLTLRNRYPDFTLGLASYQNGYSFSQWDVMVEFNIPLQQETRRAQESEAEAMLRSALARRDTTSFQLLSDLSENLAGMDAARQSEALARDTLLPQAELTFQAALAGYETGKVDFATVLDAQRAIRQAKQNRIRAQAEAQARLAEIERSIGEDL